MNQLPDSVNIFGKQYSIEYKERPSDVDKEGHNALWGQTDPWTHSMRVYAPPQFNGVEILETIIHEILHVVSIELLLELRKDERHEELSLLALALADIFARNGWVVPGLVNGRHSDSPESDGLGQFNIEPAKTIRYHEPPEIVDIIVD